MEPRRPHIAFAAAIYAIGHYAATISHAVEEFGLRPVPAVVGGALNLLFGLSLLAIAAHVAPPLLRANIRLANGALTALDRSARFLDRRIEGLRKTCISITERLLEWLRSPAWEAEEKNRASSAPSRAKQRLR